MVPHCFVADVQTLPDFPVRQSLRHKCHDLLLAAAQLRPAKPLRKLRGDLRRDAPLPGMHSPQRAEKLLPGRALQ